MTHAVKHLIPCLIELQAVFNTSVTQQRAAIRSNNDHGFCTTGGITPGLRSRLFLAEVVNDGVEGAKEMLANTAEEVHHVWVYTNNMHAYTVICLVIVSVTTRVSAAALSCTCAM